MKRGFDTDTTYHCGSDLRTYRVHLWEQPLRRWLVAQVYHWYDAHIFKMPGFGLLEKIWEWHNRNKDPLLGIPLSAEQDCKCYFLTTRERVVLATFEITKEQRDRIWPQGQRYD